MTATNAKTDRVARNTRQFTRACAFLRSVQHQLRAPRKPNDRKAAADASCAAYAAGGIVRQASEPVR
jgi:hypothetical protein